MTPKLLVGVIVLAGCSVAGLAAQSRVAVTFTSAGKDPKFDTAVDEYRRIWAAEGARVIDAMERITALKFPDKKIKAQVYEGTSFSGRGNAPMRFRASYLAEEKRRARSFTNLDIA